MYRNSTNLKIFLLSSVHFVADYYNNFLPVLLPVVMYQLGLSLTMCGMLVMVMSLTSNMIQPFLGYFVDRHDCSRGLLVAVPLAGLLICLVGYIHSQWLLFVVCALVGLMVAVMHPVGTTLMGKVGGLERMGRSMACFIVGGNIGFALAPVVVTWFLENFDILTMPILALPGVLLVLALYLVGMHRIPTAHAKKDRLGSQESMNLKEIFSNASVMKLNFAMGMRCWTHVAVTMFLPMMLLDQGYSKMMSGTLLAIFLAGSPLGGLVGGMLGDRFQHKRTMIWFMLAGILPIIYFFLNPADSILSVVALFLAGACLQAPQPSSIVWTGKLMPKYIGVASGMMMGLCFGVGSIGAALTAALGDYIGLHMAMIISIVPMLLAAVILVFTPYPQGGR